MSSEITMFFGLHSSRSPDFTEKKNGGRLIVNATNVVGWVPVAGLISAVARFIFAGILLKDLKHCSSYAKRQEVKAFAAVLILRGTVEGIGLGFLFAVPDLILWTGREIAYASPKPLSQKVQNANKNYVTKSHN